MTRTPHKHTTQSHHRSSIPHTDTHHTVYHTRKTHKQYTTHAKTDTCTKRTPIIHTIHTHTSHASHCTPHFALRLPSAGGECPRFTGLSVKTFRQGRAQQTGPLCYDHCTHSDLLPFRTLIFEVVGHKSFFFIYFLY